MNININQIPAEGLILEEETNPSQLDLDTDIIKFRGPIKIKANITKITNVVTAELSLSVSMHMNCSRCLNEFDADLSKNFRLSYQTNKLETVIDLNPDIRQEIILDYPIKPLCSPNCKGLCPKCGKNLNEGNCSCKLES